MEKSRCKADRYVNIQSLKIYQLKYSLGRQLFEGGGDRTLEDASLVEEGTESVDISQFDREERHQEVADESGVHLSDSD